MSLHPRRVPDWVRDMREAIEYIHLDMAGLDRQAFEADGKTIRAVTKSIADIGEAANQIMQAMPNFQTENPDIWQHLKRVYAMRNAQCAPARLFPHRRQRCLGHGSPAFAGTGQAADKSRWK